MPGSADRRDMPITEPVPNEQQMTPVVGRWILVSDNSPLDTNFVAALTLEAISPLIAHGKSIRPTLYVVYYNKDLSCFVQFSQQAILGYGTDPAQSGARLRFDNDPVLPVEMKQGMKRNSLIFNDPDSIIGRLRTHHYINLIFTLSNGPKAVATFELIGFSQALQQLKSLCGLG